jgi:D-3-phosphoglycerate dehydrogenase
VKITILDDYFDTLRGLPSFQRIADLEVTVWNDHVNTPTDLVERLYGTDVLVLFRERSEITAELLDRLPNLKLISMRGDYPHVDVEACTRNGIVFSSKLKGGATSHSTAELTWALILASMRQIPQQMASLQSGTWQMGVGRSLRGLTIGLYGYGRIARTVASYARAFGMDLRWWGSGDGRKRAEADGAIVAASRKSFFADSDIVSVHVRLRPETRSIITSQDLDLMDPSALFVNTSRAALLESGALIEALNNGRPGFAALDVFDSEPATDPSDPLIKHPHVVCTPHIGFVTEDELDRQFGDIYDQVLAFAEGNPINVVNSAVLG